LKRSADAGTADLTRSAASSNIDQKTGQQMKVSLAAAMTGDAAGDLSLRDGDVLTIRQVPGWGDLGASITVRGEVQHPGSYGIKPGERLSSLLERAGGFSAEGYPYGAVLMRREVREIEERSYAELVRRVQTQQVSLKQLPDNEAKLSASAQAQTTLDQLRANPPLGRLVVHIQPDIKAWRNSSGDIAVRDGDVLVIPKKANYVMVNGQVYNPTAIAYRPGKSAKWYLGQAGGLTQLANKGAVFVIRADGSVIPAKNNSVLWAGNPLNAVLKPGDAIVVPEKALGAANRNWSNLLQSAQIASSIAITVSYLLTRP
jgi:protein involved in polysaccharide export with SLBB domain